MVLCSLFLRRFFLRFVMADRTARCSAERAVMAGDVACNAPHRGPGEAACASGTRDEGGGQGEDGGKQR